MILTESRSLAGCLTQSRPRIRCADLRHQRPSGRFLHTDVAPHLVDGSRVLYLGDFDLAGADIEANTKRVLERSGISGGGEDRDLNWERLALTAEQVADYNLPVIVKFDKRFSNGGSHQAVETEALSQRLIVEIVRNRLMALLPESLDQILIREGVQREQVRALLAATLA